jgi:integrase/recombinase XerD
MARAGMRVSEALRVTPNDIEDRKIVIRDTKSGRDTEVVFLPQKLADRLKAYIRAESIEPDRRVFLIKYPAARLVVKKAGRLVGIDLSPHDLRRHAATYASRAVTPLEIVSKVILRHVNLSTTLFGKSQRSQSHEVD